MVIGNLPKSNSSDYRLFFLVTLAMNTMNFKCVIILLIECVVFYLVNLSR